MSRRFAGFAALGFVVLWGCGAPIRVPALAPEDLPRLQEMGNFPEHVYRIEPGYKLQISFTFHSERNQEVMVRPDGKVSVHEVGDMAVAGLTTAELEQRLVEETSNRLRNPTVVVGIASYSEKFVYVGGEVLRPGTIPYRKGLTPLHAVLAAGGPRETARIDSVILVRTGGVRENFISRKLDLATVVMDGVKEPLYLAPHDVIYVPKTPIANANVWVKQHIMDLIPFLRLGSIPVAP